MNINIREIKVHVDERGWLAELLRQEDVGGDFGQFYLTTAYPNVVKANHYHKIARVDVCYKRRSKISFM
ncbi:MAG: hypothetical protein ACE5KT_12410 [Methanosarcinales archaeon]